MNSETKVRPAKKQADPLRQKPEGEKPELARLPNVSKIEIKNYKCFDPKGTELFLNTPDGKTAGSGLNILVGGNGHGKTSSLEALSLLTESTYVIQNKIDVFDFFNPEIPITITFHFDSEFKYKMPSTYRGCYFICVGFEIEVKLRENKSPGKLLSPPLTTSAKVIAKEAFYRNADGDEMKPIDDYHRTYEEDRLENEINVFSFDKSKTRQLEKSQFKTSFGKIVDDLNWRFFRAIKHDKGLQDELLAKLSNEYFQEVKTQAQKGIGEKVAAKAKEFFNDDNLSSINIEFINLKWPFSDAFLALRKADQIHQIPVSSLGSGIESIYCFLFLKSLSEVSKGTIIYLLDEPESSLFPQAQKKLFEMLVAESMFRQVVVSTHSTQFIPPAHLDKIVKYTRSNGKLTTHRLENQGLILKLKEDKVFYHRHRELFFVNSAIFLEGDDDIACYTAFCLKNGFEDLVDHFQWMNGKDQVFVFEELCKSFGIKFSAIVDRDFSLDQSFWARSRNKRFTDQFTKFLKSKKITYSEEELTAALKLEMVEKPRVDEKRAESHVVNDVLINKVLKRDIFVLLKGEVSEYLDRNGEIVGEDQDEKKNELLTIFSEIRKLV